MNKGSDSYGPFSAKDGYADLGMVAPEQRQVLFQAELERVYQEATTAVFGPIDEPGNVWISQDSEGNMQSSLNCSNSEHLRCIEVDGILYRIVRISGIEVEREPYGTICETIEVPNLYGMTFELVTEADFLGARKAEEGRKVVTRRRFFGLAALGVAGFAATKTPYWKIYWLYENLKVLRGELADIADEFDGLTLMELVKQPQHYTGLLQTGTKKIDEIISIIDDVDGEDLCIDGAYFIEARKQISNIVKRFQSGDVQVVLAGARYVKRGQAAVLKLKGMANQYSNRMKQEVARKFGAGNAARLSGWANELLGDAVKYSPSGRTAKLIAENAEELAELAVALADFLLAAERLIERLKKLQGSLDGLACEPWEEMDPVLKLAMGNPYEAKRIEVREAILLYKELDVDSQNKSKVIVYQSFLFDYGFFATSNRDAAVDGDFGQMTKGAETLFVNNIKTIDGCLDDFLDKQEADAHVECDRVVVMRFQKLFASLGYLGQDHEIDGLFDYDTARAYAEFIDYVLSLGFEKSQVRRFDVAFTE